MYISEHRRDNEFVPFFQRFCIALYNNFGEYCVEDHDDIDQIIYKQDMVWWDKSYVYKGLKKVIENYMRSSNNYTAKETEAEIDRGARNGFWKVEKCKQKRLRDKVCWFFN